MKKLLVLAFALVSTTALAGEKVAAKAAAQDDAVKAVIASIDSALTKHDGKAVADLFVEDGTFVSPMGDGKLVKGHDAIKAAHEGMLAANKDFTAKHTVENIRWIGKDHAIVDCSVVMTGLKAPEGMPAGAPAPLFHAVVVLELKGGKWLVDDARPYSIMPMAPAAPSKS